MKDNLKAHIKLGNPRPNNTGDIPQTKISINQGKDQHIGNSDLLLVCNSHKILKVFSIQCRRYAFCFICKQ